MWCRKDFPRGRNLQTESKSYNATIGQGARRFRDFAPPESTVEALLTDSTTRGFAISFSTSRRIPSRDFFLFLAMSNHHVTA